ncbi:MAG: M14 family metallopeptidase [Planctomycetota bacterium]
MNGLHHRGALAAVTAALLATGAARAQGEAPLAEPTGVEARAWDHFVDYAGLVKLMEAMRDRWPEWITLEPIGKSVQGRTLWVMTVTDRSKGAPETKPAMYVDGNIHGNEVQGSEAALYTAWYLCRFAPQVVRLRRILEARTLYVVPCMNPDGRDSWFHDAHTAHSSRGGQEPTDNDGDGLYDEDGPNDLDGDGNITRMRKRVPLGQGTFRLDPKDPRNMLRVEEGEQGDWILLGQEGGDDDGDGRVDEDGPGGYDPNRDFGSDWQPGWIQYGARTRPFALPESRAVRDFLLSRPNVAGVQAFHNSGGMILRGPGSEHVAFEARDLPVYDALGRKGEELLPFYRYMTVWKDLYTVHGGFVDWTYLGLGVLSFTNEMWTGKRRTQGTRELGRDEALEWDHDHAFDAHFVPWKPYDHPVYGAVEIGGPVKYTGRVPPGFLIPEMLHRNAAFVLYQCDELPELELERTDVRPAGAGLAYVDVVIRNLRLTPTRTAQAAARHIGRPDLLLCEPEGVEVLAAGRVRDRFRPEATVPLPERQRPTRIPIEEGVGSRGRLSIRYLVRGQGTLRFRYEAEKAKDLAFELPLR